MREETEPGVVCKVLTDACRGGRPWTELLGSGSAKSSVPSKSGLDASARRMRTGVSDGDVALDMPPWYVRTTKPQPFGATKKTFSVIYFHLISILFTV